MLSGCWIDKPRQTPPSETTETRVDEKLTPEAARKALVAVDGNGHEMNGWGWELLYREAKTATIKAIDENTCEIGLWHCNLANKTFDGTVIFPKAHSHHFNEWHGVFELTPEGKWRAKVTGASSAHGPRGK
jgi:hypothetical protein